MFAHWPVGIEELRPFVPKALAIQEFDGTAWIGVVPFRMAGVARRPLPPVPGTATFPELNVRTYVEQGGRAGVWFLSLDATNVLAVWAAKKFFHLPYFRSTMSLAEDPSGIQYSSVRRHHPEGLSYIAEYGPTTDPYKAEPDTLEHWLTERYCLYARSPRGEIQRTDVHHAQWSLQAAQARIEKNDLGKPFGLSLSEDPTVLHFSRNIDVVVWNPLTVASGERSSAL